MKILVNIMLCVALVGLLMAPMGCCTTPSAPSGPKTFANCIDNLKGVVCNPTDAQKQAAQQVINFVAAAAVIIVPLVINGVVVTPDEVVIALNTVVSGGCIGITELSNILAWFQQITTPTPAKAMAKAAGQPIPNVDPLWHWIGK